MHKASNLQKHWVILSKQVPTFNGLYTIMAADVLVLIIILLILCSLGLHMRSWGGHGCSRSGESSFGRSELTITTCYCLGGLRREHSGMAGRNASTMIVLVWECNDDIIVVYVFFLSDSNLCQSDQIQMAQPGSTKSLSQGHPGAPSVHVATGP